MKKMCKTLLVLFSIIISIFSSKVNAFAEKYTYSVTFYAGEQGSFTNMSAFQLPEGAKILASSDKVVISGLKYGDTVGCSAQSAVNLNADSKYYVRGIRLSGRDNNKVGYSVFSVYEDQDYVVAYGIKGELTQYTINYVDIEGNELAPSQTYHGNVGDEPVIAYLYIEGYTPTEFNISQVLVSDSTQNIFNFVYTQSLSNSNGGENTDDNNDDNGGDAGNNGDNGDGGNGDNGNGGNGDNGNGGNGDNGNGDNGNGDNGNGDNGNNGDGGNGDATDPTVVPDDNTNPDQPAPSNIEEPEVPLDDGDGGKKDIVDDKIPLSKILFENGLIIPIGIVFITLVVFVVVLIKLIGKSKKNATNSDSSNKAEDDKNNEK